MAPACEDLISMMMSVMIMMMIVSATTSTLVAHDLVDHGLGDALHARDHGRDGAHALPDHGRGDDVHDHVRNTHLLRDVRHIPGR